MTLPADGDCGSWAVDKRITPLGTEELEMESWAAPPFPGNNSPLCAGAFVRRKLEISSYLPTGIIC